MSPQVTMWRLKRGRGFKLLHLTPYQVAWLILLGGKLVAHEENRDYPSPGTVAALPVPFLEGAS